MKATRIIIAAMIAAMFIALPIVSAVSSATDTEKSWTEGEASVYYKTTGMNDTEFAEKIVNFDYLVDYCLFIGTVDHSTVEITGISDLTVENGYSQKNGKLQTITNSYTKIEGKVEFSGRMASDGYFDHSAHEPYESGDMYTAINEYFGELSAGTSVSYSVTVKMTDVYKWVYECAEIADVYAVVSNLQRASEILVADADITIGSKTISCHYGYDMNADKSLSFGFDSPLTKESETPSMAKATMVTTVKRCDNSKSAIVDGKECKVNFDKNLVTESLKEDDCKDMETFYFYYTYSKEAPDINYNYVLNEYFADDNEAKQFLDENNIEHSEDYSRLDAIVEDALSVKSDDGTKTAFIIIVVIDALLALLVLIVFAVRKKD